MVQITATKPTLRDAVEAASRGLIAVQHWPDGSYVNFPLSYPSGASVTIKVELGADGFRVTDNGFAFREAESMGAEASFPGVARAVTDGTEISTNRRLLFVNVTNVELEQAMCDVAETSWQIADRIVKRAMREDVEISASLRGRLANVFGRHALCDETVVKGHSTSEWPVSAVVRVQSTTAIFQAVSSHANAVFRVSTAFHDISLLDNPPRLVSVVKSKEELGPKLDLLAQAGRVIEEDQPDRVFWKAAA
jgi:hypothetical protein